MRLRHTFNNLFALLGMLLLMHVSNAALAQVTLEEINFVTLPGSQFEIELNFNSAPPQPEVFVLDSPARLTLDFTDVASALTERRYPLNFSSADSVMVLEAQGRTRMVVNLTNPAAYATRVQGNSLYVTVGSAEVAAASVAAAPASDGQPARFTAPVIAGNDINGIDFKRSENGSGQIIVELTKNGLNANVTQNSNSVTLEFANASLDTSKQMRLDVTDFATPVRFVSLYSEGGQVVVKADVAGEFEYLAYQSNNQYVVNISPVLAVAGSTGGGTGRNREFTGERISLDFQNIDIRSVLQILADFNDFSLVTGDNVTGNVTLRLDNVPWDQALDLVLRTKDLGQRQIGNVLYVAPAAEIATSELAELETNQQAVALSPLVTEYIEVNYAVASEMLLLVTGSGEAGGILTERGRAVVDNRTNTLIVQDVQTAIDDIKVLLARLDVPVRQVLIEARIVNASVSFGKALGIRWGGGQMFPGAGERFTLSGNMNSSIEMGNNLSEFNNGVSTAILGGATETEAILSNPLAPPTFPDALVVDLGLDGAPSSIALGYAGNNGLLQLELSALEASGNGEVIAQPKVTTQDQQPARIESGIQIPYQAQAGGTAGGSTTEFVTAALSLQVTPQITPDGRIIMLLDIHQDSVVPGSGAVPAIATNSVNTRVLVNDGDTIVLGGVFREEVTTTVSKTPLLGDLPYVGNIFRKTENNESKTELLIFITPSIINELL